MGGGGRVEMGTPWAAAVGPAWVEIDLDAVVGNLAAVRRLLAPGCRLLAVVKANAYGHGAVDVARALVGAGADGLGVSTVAEGLALRVAGLVGPILVFTPPRAVDVGPALASGLSVSVVSIASARMVADAVERQGLPATVHLKCDTGMGRYGLRAADLPAAASELARLNGPLRWEGVYTHFPRGGDAPTCRRQLSAFLKAVDGAEAAGLRFAVRHAAASSTVLSCPEAHLDMVRVGNLLYGDSPPGLSRPSGLRRGFALRAEVAQVRDLPAGATVGYGSAWRAPRPTRVGVVPVGFADGLDTGPLGPYRRPGVLLRALARAFLEAMGLGRRLRGAAAGDIEIGGHRVPVLGRVGMQQVTVDLSGLPAGMSLPPAVVRVRALAAGAHLARVYLRDGVPLRAATLSGPVEHPSRDGATPGKRESAPDHESPGIP